MFFNVESYVKSILFAPILRFHLLRGFPEVTPLTKLHFCCRGSTSKTSPFSTTCSPHENYRTCKVIMWRTTFISRSPSHPLWSLSCENVWRIRYTCCINHTHCQPGLQAAILVDDLRAFTVFNRGNTATSFKISIHARCLLPSRYRVILCLPKTSISRTQGLRGRRVFVHGEHGDTDGVNRKFDRPTWMRENIWKNNFHQRGIFQRARSRGPKTPFNEAFELIGANNFKASAQKQIWNRFSIWHTSAGMAQPGRRQKGNQAPEGALVIS